VLADVTATLRQANFLRQLHYPPLALPSVPAVVGRSLEYSLRSLRILQQDVLHYNSMRIAIPLIARHRSFT
jgi:hypothetical protein